VAAAREAISARVEVEGEEDPADRVADSRLRIIVTPLASRRNPAGKSGLPQSE